MFPPEFVPAGQCPSHQVFDPEIDGAKVSTIEYLNAKNGRLKLDVPSVVGEHKVEMRGTVPESWGLV